ncbi:flagellar biosynthesis protein FlhF, partial [mine drainage metagenome]
MLIKTFEGADMNDALKKVKKELGGDAVILSSRKVHPDAAGGSRGGVVVTAGLPQVDPPWAQHLPGAPEETSGGVRVSEMDALREMVERMEREWGAGSSQALRGLISRIGEV